MFIDVRAIGFNLTDSLQIHAESRAEAALGPFARWVSRVTVRLEDVNADRGGIDKRCSLVVVLRRRGTVVAEAMNADMYAAIDKAALRIRRSVLSQLKRRTGRERKYPQRPGALLAY